MPESPTCAESRDGACLENLGSRCYGRRCPGVCRRVAAGHKGYRTLASRKAAPDTAVHRTRKAVPSGRPIKAVAIMAACCSGGAEDATESMIRHTAPEVEWSAVLASPTLYTPEMVERMRAICPFEPGGVESPGAKSLIASADLLVCWGAWLRPIVRGVNPRPTTVYVSHAPQESLWGSDILADVGPIDCVVGVNPSSIARVKDIHPGCAIIPNLANAGRLKPTVDRESFRAALGVKPDEKLIGMVGRFSNEKRPHWLAEVLAKLPDRFVGVWCGGGHEYATMARIAQECHVAHAVRMLPARPDVGTVYRSLDWLLGCSEFESYWLAGVEAMLCEVPVVSTDVGVVRDHPDWNLARVSEANPEAFAGAILDDEADEPGRVARVDRARAWASMRADPGPFRRAWLDLFNRLVPRA